MVGFDGGITPRFHLSGRKILYVSCDRPGVSIRIGDGAKSVPPKHRLWFLDGLRSGLDGLTKGLVHIGNIEPNGRGSSTEMFRSPHLGARELVAEHEHRVADLDLGVPDLTPWTEGSVPFLGTKGADIELDRLRRIVYDEGVGRGVVSRGHPMLGGCHSSPTEPVKITLVRCQAYH